MSLYILKQKCGAVVSNVIITKAPNDERTDDDKMWAIQRTHTRLEQSLLRNSSRETSCPCKRSAVVKLFRQLWSLLRIENVQIVSKMMFIFCLEAEMSWHYNSGLIFHCLSDEFTRLWRLCSPACPFIVRSYFAAQFGQPLLWRTFFAVRFHDVAFLIKQIRSPHSHAIFLPGLFFLHCVHFYRKARINWWQVISSCICISLYFTVCCITVTMVTVT